MPNPLDLRGLLFRGAGFKPGECAGKVVVVTGAGQGIGLQTARAFAALGGIVVIAEISKETGKAAEASINTEGGKAIFVQTDVADAWSVSRLGLAVASIFGPVDILVNNATRRLSAPLVAVGRATRVFSKERAEFERYHRQWTRHFWAGFFEQRRRPAA